MVEAITNNNEWWIGIDLGTTFTAAGLWRDGRVEILQNADDGA